jgi:predicted HicB family RNase H-like nuclease
VAGDLNVKVGEERHMRLKVYAAEAGETIKSLIRRWIDEQVPPLPREREATE